MLLKFLCLDLLLFLYSLLLFHQNLNLTLGVFKDVGFELTLVFILLFLSLCNLQFLLFLILLLMFFQLLYTHRLTHLPLTSQLCLPPLQFWTHEVLFQLLHSILLILPMMLDLLYDFVAFQVTSCLLLTQLLFLEHPLINQLSLLIQDSLLIQYSLFGCLTLLCSELLDLLLFLNLLIILQLSALGIHSTDQILSYIIFCYFVIIYTLLLRLWGHA